MLAPDPSEIHPMDTISDTPHWVISATEFEIHSYDFTLWDNAPDNPWDTVIWRLENNGSWLFEPFGEKGHCCKVYVLDRVTDTVWLKATVYNSCGSTQGVERSFWLICSFYDMEENMSPLQISISPNPSRGDMHIDFGEIEGRVAIKVFDMTGTTIDQFDWVALPKSQLFYSLNSYPSGIYLFVFNHDGHTVTQKVIIIK